MKWKFLIISIIVLLPIISYLADRIFTPPTTAEMLNQAERYASSLNRNLPTHRFTQDGCTLFFDSFLWLDFTQACLEHDIKYWLGGTEQDRLAADLALREQVIAAGPLGSLFANSMFLAVRKYGESDIVRKFHAHWGYGWDARP